MWGKLTKNAVYVAHELMSNHLKRITASYFADSNSLTTLQVPWMPRSLKPHIFMQTTMTDKTNYITTCACIKYSNNTIKSLGLWGFRAVHDTQQKDCCWTVCNHVQFLWVEVAPQYTYVHISLIHNCSIEALRVVNYGFKECTYAHMVCIKVLSWNLKWQMLLHISSSHNFPGINGFGFAYARIIQTHLI